MVAASRQRVTTAYLDPCWRVTIEKGQAAARGEAGQVIATNLGVKVIIDHRHIGVVHGEGGVDHGGVPTGKAGGQMCSRGAGWGRVRGVQVSKTVVSSV